MVTRHNFYPCAVVALCAIALVGCGNTAQGLQQDANRNSAAAATAAKEAADNAAVNTKDAADFTSSASKAAGEKASDAAKNAGAALKDVTAKAGAGAFGLRIKAALASNPITNAPDVHVDVNVDDAKVRLSGTTGTKEESDEAYRITKALVSREGAHQAIENSIRLVL